MCCAGVAFLCCDGIIDNERIGLSGSINHHNYIGPNGDPSIAPHFYSYLKSLWRNADPMTFGGTGYNPDDPDLIPAKYIFSGNSDPFFLGTDGVDPNYPDADGWAEITSPTFPGDRRVLALLRIRSIVCPQALPLP